jgi:hypothetical protein
MASSLPKAALLGAVLLLFGSAPGLLVAGTTGKQAQHAKPSIHCQLEDDGTCNCESPRRKGTGKNRPCIPPDRQTGSYPGRREPPACPVDDISGSPAGDLSPYTANQYGGTNTSQCEYCKGSVTWDQYIYQDMTDARNYTARVRIRRIGRCTFRIDFYPDGSARVRELEYFNEDRLKWPAFPDRLEVETIYGKLSGHQFRSDLRKTPSRNGNGLYDIVWINPTVGASQSNRTEYTTDWGGNLPEQPPRAPGQAYIAYCIGKVMQTQGQRGQFTNYIQARLLGVPLQGQSLPLEVGTTIVADLQKQVPRATVTMNWYFKAPQQPQAQQRGRLLRPGSANPGEY